MDDGGVFVAHGHERVDDERSRIRGSDEVGSDEQCRQRRRHFGEQIWDIHVVEGCVKGERDIFAYRLDDSSASEELDVECRSSEEGEPNECEHGWNEQDACDELADRPSFANTRDEHAYEGCP